MLCPYPDCDNLINSSWAGDQAESCVCEYRQPIVRCAECGMPNRAGSVYCRRCRSTSQADHRTNRSSVGAKISQVDFLAIPGKFRRPPLAGAGFLYAFSASGKLSQMSPRRHAKALEIGDFREPSTGVNIGALVNVSAHDGIVKRGWTFLAAARSGIFAMHLATAKISALYEPRLGEEISANRSEADATGFRGLAANADFCAFVVSGSTGDFLLTLKSFSKDAPILQPAAVHGSRAAGPALHDGTLMLCSDEEAAVYHVATQRSAKIPLPRGFEPLLRPSSEELSVSPGSIPMAAWRERDDRLVACLAGVQHGAPGLLQIDFSRNTTDFRDLSTGSSIYTNTDGSLSANLIDRVERIGANGQSVSTSRLQAGMPACFGAGFRCWFREEAYRGRHRAAVSVDSLETETTFEDPLCNGNTCYGVYSIGGEMLVAYSHIGSKQEDWGMRFAHWSNV